MRGKNNRTKEHIPVSTCNLENETLTYILCYFKALFGNRTRICPASQESNLEFEIAIIYFL